MNDIYNGVDVNKLYSQFDQDKLSLLRWQVLKRDLANTILQVYPGLSANEVDKQVEAAMSNLMIGLFTEAYYSASGMLPGDVKYFYSVSNQSHKTDTMQAIGDYSIFKKMY